MSGCAETLPNGCMVYAVAATSKLQRAGTMARTLCVKQLDGAGHSFSMFESGGWAFSYDINEGTRPIARRLPAAALDAAELVLPVWTIRRAWWLDELITGERREIKGNVRIFTL